MELPLTAALTKHTKADRVKAENNKKKKKKNSQSINQLNKRLVQLTRKDMYEIAVP